ncbi:dCTP deaminase [Litorimonas taeanensis]|uniref:dCTP deaminase n=1 Tax=Litorimonas taeanensis TaxID=568099 RepID=A0A420WDA9_9PROT|nr:2'-deoxycytidine 5'-triphosphate deaminase [Litorimonas taeanensis]RKQ68991.1 dCTP deaminase [Litorimonas taeanensis]
MNKGILPEQAIRDLIDSGVIRNSEIDDLFPDAQELPPLVQPASLDLQLGVTAYRMRASYLPGEGGIIKDTLQDLCLHSFDITHGAVLETGCVYLLPLVEALDLPKNLSAAANPKSSTGRLDVFTRVICDGATRFDSVPAGYSGPLYVEVAPRTFPILVRPGDRLVQLRFRSGEAQILNTQTVSIDLRGIDGSDIIGWRARRHSGMVDLRGIGAHKARDYWEPLMAPNEQLVLDPEEFYILASQEAVCIPQNRAAEMAPIAPEIGEFRAHYAGFFDPGFGLEEAGGQGSRAVLEVRGRDVPFLLRHGQSVAKLVFEPLSEDPQELYGTKGSHYQSQGLRLSKHFTL